MKWISFSVLGVALIALVGWRLSEAKANRYRDAECAVAAAAIQYLAANDHLLREQDVPPPEGVSPERLNTAPDLYIFTTDSSGGVNAADCDWPSDGINMSVIEPEQFDQIWNSLAELDRDIAAVYWRVDRVAPVLRIHVERITGDRHTRQAQINLSLVLGYACLFADATLVDGENGWEVVAFERGGPHC